jgi:hypothetical protein
MRWWTEQRGEVECSEDGEMPFSIWATKADVTAAQAAIMKELQKMSATLEQQLQTLTANIAADAAAVKADLDMILSTLTPGATLTQADIDALTAVSNSMDSLKTAADAGANPAPPPGP